MHDCARLVFGGRPRLPVTNSACHAFSGVPFVVEKTGGNPIYLARCGERLMAALDRREGGQWVQHSGDGCLTNQDMTPVELAPGATR